MSTGSFQKPKTLSALVVVEGPTEREFFQRFGEKLGLNLTIHAVCCNVYNLYRWMTENAVPGQSLNRTELSLDIPKLIAEHTKDAVDVQTLQQHYDAFYLIYDCDLQDTLYLVQGGGATPLKDDLPPIGERARANLSELRQMIELLNDEYSITVGRLFLNYPMVESIWDADSFYDPFYLNRAVELSTLAQKGAYKHEVAKRLLFYAKDEMAEWTYDDYCDLIRMNLDKSRRLLKLDESESDVIEKCQSQQDILNKQCDWMSNNASLMVLNTSVFIPLDYPSLMTDVWVAGRMPTITHLRDGDSPESGYVLFWNTKGQLPSCLETELQGLIRVERNVDAIFFMDDFCRALPDYRQAIQRFDMSQKWAKDAVLKKLEKSTAWNWCCRAEMARGTECERRNVVERAKNKVIILKQSGGHDD